VIESSGPLLQWLLRGPDLGELFRARLRQCGVTGEIELPDQPPEWLTKKPAIQRIRKTLWRRHGDGGPFVYPAKFKKKGLHAEDRQKLAFYFLLTGAAAHRVAVFQDGGRSGYETTWGGKLDEAEADRTVEKLLRDADVIRKSPQIQSFINRLAKSPEKRRATCGISWTTPSAASSGARNILSSLSASRLNATTAAPWTLPSGFRSRGGASSFTVR
jgi:hypothetical protein